MADLTNIQGLQDNRELRNSWAVRSDTEVNHLIGNPKSRIKKVRFVDEIESKTVLKMKCKCIHPHMEPTKSIREPTFSKTYNHANIQVIDTEHTERLYADEIRKRSIEQFILMQTTQDTRRQYKEPTNPKRQPLKRRDTFRYKPTMATISQYGMV